MKPVADQHFGHSRRVFVDLFQPLVERLKRPTIGDVKHENNSIGSPRIALDNCGEAALARSVPERCESDR